MNHDSPGAALNPLDPFANKISRDEAHEDLDELNATRKTITDLLNYKRSLSDVANEDFEKINEIKRRAIEAVNNLFNDIISPGKD